MMMMLTAVRAMPMVPVGVMSAKVVTPTTMDDNTKKQILSQPVVREGINFDPKVKVGIALALATMTMPFVHIADALAGNTSAQLSFSRTLGCAGKELGAGSTIGDTTVGAEIKRFNTEQACQNALAAIKNVLRLGAMPEGVTNNGTNVIMMNVDVGQSLNVPYRPLEYGYQFQVGGTTINSY